MKQINMNSYVYFRLSKRGKQLLQNNEEFRIFSHRIGKDYEMQIHEFARIVGPHMIMGLESVIKNMNVWFDEKDIEERSILEAIEPDESR